MKICRYIVLVCALVVGVTTSAQLAFINNSRDVFDYVPDASTGLGHVYVLHDTDGVGLTYTATTDNPVRWCSYGEFGGGIEEPIEGVQTAGRVTTLPQLLPDKGYIIYEGTSRFFFWVSDYSAHRLVLRGAQAVSDGDCSTVTIAVDGSGSDLAYYTIEGVRQLLDRQITLSYYNLQWNDSTLQWDQKLTEVNQETFKSTIVLQAPFCNTSFMLTGDRFEKFWGEQQQAETNTYTTAAVDVRTTAVQEERHVDNEKKQEEGTTTLGGSAPAHITFTAYCTDAVVHKEWQMASDPDFNDIRLRLSGDVYDETFTEAGISYWRFIGSNGDGTCEAVSDTYTVNIGESELVCPNVFTPGSSTGVNDEWKVSYRSIVEFRCNIFNRWGNQVCVLTDPSQSWDGRYHGKLVPAGVYYYVIKAVGSDGHKYNLSGDINIIRYKRVVSGGGDDGGGTVVTRDDDTTTTE